MTLVQRLQRVNDRLQALPMRLGVPQFTIVVLQDGTVQSLMSPSPQVTQVEPRQVQAFLGLAVEVALDDLWLTGISRQYSEELLSKAIYIINAQEVVTGSNIYTGKQARCLYIDRTELLTYRALVRVNRGR